VGALVAVSELWWATGRALEVMCFGIFSLKCNRSFNGCLAESWKLEKGGMWGVEYKFDSTELSRGRSLQGSNVSWLGDDIHFFLSTASHLMDMHLGFRESLLVR
jgi:hypothetical protein